MATCPAAETNISNLPADVQGRTSITNSETTTFVSVTGRISNLVVMTNDCYSKLSLDGKFNKSSFVGGAEVPEKFTVTGKGSKLSKSNIVLGNDSFNDTINFKKKTVANKVVIKNFSEGDKLKYKGKTYTFDDVSGNKFEGLSKKRIKLA